MKYLTEERFIVNSNDNEGRKKYLENYDRIFGEKQEEPAHCAGCDEVVCECDVHWPDCEKLCTKGAKCNCERGFDK
jgi:hypothetical protein